jgi:hypothetical protein
MPKAHRRRTRNSIFFQALIPHILKFPNRPNPNFPAPNRPNQNAKFKIPSRAAPCTRKRLREPLGVEMYCPQSDDQRARLHSPTRTLARKTRIIPDSLFTPTGVLASAPDSKRGHRHTRGPGPPSLLACRATWATAARSTRAVQRTSTGRTDGMVTRSRWSCGVLGSKFR